MSLQQQQLDDLSTWLTQMEARISAAGRLGADIAQVRDRVVEFLLPMAFELGKS